MRIAIPIFGYGSFLVGFGLDSTMWNTGHATSNKAFEFLWIQII